MGLPRFIDRYLLVSAIFRRRGDGLHSISVWLNWAPFFRGNFGVEFRAPDLGCELFSFSRYPVSAARD